MSKEIKIGLIGAGWMGKAHTTAFHNARMIFGDDMPVFELVSDVSEDAVAKFAKSMGYNRYTTNWMDVVTDPEIDLVDVATPNCMHYEMAKAALEHGKHVFCEKPLSLSAEQSRELADLAKEKGVVNYCGFSNIMNPANQYVAELVKSGKLGKIAADRGFKLCFHHHMATVVQTFEETKRLMDNTDPRYVYLCFDTGHFTFSKEDAVKAAKEFGPRIGHVHLKDIRPDMMEKAYAEGFKFRKAVLEGCFTIPGDGCVDYPGVFKALHDAHYEGWFIVEAEQDPAKANPLEYAKMAREYIKKTAGI